jgi:6-phosphogluconolactonase
VNGHVDTVVAKDPRDLACRAARRFEALVTGSSDQRFAVALAGGNTPRQLYEVLAAPPFRDRIPWGRLELFFGDERAVGPEHPDSNYGMAQRALLSKVPVIAHRMRAEAAAADEYERLIRERITTTREGVPVFDLVLLGMGKDGHTASLFPGTRALEEEVRLVVMNEVPQLNTQRMTFTYPLLNAARRVWVLVPGADKREMVGQCMAALERRSAERPWPIVGVRPTDGELIWWLDDASAGGR